MKMFASIKEVKSDFTIFSVTISIVTEMYSDLEKSWKFLFLFVYFFVCVCGVENIAAKGTVVDIDGQF